MINRQIWKVVKNEQYEITPMRREVIFQGPLCIIHELRAKKITMVTVTRFREEENALQKPTRGGGGGRGTR